MLKVKSVTLGINPLICNRQMYQLVLSVLFVTSYLFIFEKDATWDFDQGSVEACVHVKYLVHDCLLRISTSWGVFHKDFKSNLTLSWT